MDEGEASRRSEDDSTDRDNQPQIDKGEFDDQNEVEESGGKESERKSPASEELEEGEVCSDEEKENTKQDVNISEEESSSKLDQGEIDPPVANSQVRDSNNSGNGFGMVENRYRNNRNDDLMRNYAAEDCEAPHSYDRGGWNRDQELRYDRAARKPTPPPDRLTSAWELGIKQAREARKKSEKRGQTKDSQIDSYESRYYKDDYTNTDETIRKERRDENYDYDRRDSRRGNFRRDFSPSDKRNYGGHSPSDDGSEVGYQRSNRRPDDWTDPWRRSPFRARHSSGSHWNRNDRYESRRRYSRSYSRDRSRTRSRSRDRYPRSRHRSPYFRRYDEREPFEHGDNSHGRYRTPSPNYRSSMNERRSRSTSRGRYEKTGSDRPHSGSRSPSRSPHSGRSRRSTKSGQQPNSSKRKEQLLQELKDVEDAIRRKKTKGSMPFNDKEI
ncbi:uncharacterized protein TRIADDRAFT_55606 [Trichoplax adhaerens]|uniref:Btz domain-containing protein n=1 Tax=Trichoplax adhaerens TaxID=10228 RepID=B3RVC7_TRIAD|nr:predicted protein [Trichoplax adhaerens]EDV25479.1 predicted protein [Trichoplax adhaerens]|eukprot:XP_002111512.1 predicted protein [Trichoplax adhaerens]